MLEIIVCDGLDIETKVFLGDNKRVEVPSGFTATFVASDPSSKRVYVIQEPTRAGKPKHLEEETTEPARVRQFGFKSYELLVGDPGKPLERAQTLRLEEARDFFYARITYVISGHTRELYIPVLMTEPPRDCYLGKSVVLDRLL